MAGTTPGSVHTLGTLRSVEGQGVVRLEHRLDVGLLEDLPVGVKVRVLLGDEAAVLPDLEVVETMIGDALANAA